MAHQHQQLEHHEAGSSGQCLQCSFLQDFTDSASLGPLETGPGRGVTSI